MLSQTLPDLPTNGPIYVVGYVRVSDPSQKEGASLETQAAAIRRYCEDRGWILLDIVEEVYSGEYLFERKQLGTRVRALVRSGKIHVVIVNSLDRLTRNQVHQAVLLYEMIEHGVRLESVTEPLDISSWGSFQRQAIGHASAVEREKIIERVARGTQHRIDKGYMIGVGVPKYGYSWGEEHKIYLINEEEARIVYEVFERFVIHDQSMRSIAKWLNDSKVATRHKGHDKGPGHWVATTIKNMLASEEYRGVGYNRTLKWLRVNGQRKGIAHPNPVRLADGVVPRIVSDDLWYAAQAKLAVAKTEPSRNNREPVQSLLHGGFILCGCCHRFMQVQRERTYFTTEKKQGRRKKHRKAQYVCTSGGSLPGRCQRRASIAIDVIDQAVWDAVKKMLDNLDWVREVLTAHAVNNAEVELHSLENQIKDTKEEIRRCVKDMEKLRGYTREAVQKELALKEQHLEGLEDLKRGVVSNVKEEEDIQKDIEAFLAWCLAFQGNYDAAAFEEKRRTLRHLGLVVYVYQTSDSDHPKYVINRKPELFNRCT